MAEARIINVKKQTLGKHEQLAQDLRAEFARNGVFVANLVSSPGAGKTELLTTLRRKGCFSRSIFL